MYMEDPIVFNSQRVLTTLQLATAYGTEVIKVQQNFNNNKHRYLEGKHYFLLKGSQLKEFLRLENIEVQNLSKIRSLYLWTEKGAWLHAKSLNTDRAWEAYELLVDNYYRAVETFQRFSQKQLSLPQESPSPKQQSLSRLREARELFKLIKENKEILTQEAHHTILSYATELLTGKSLESTYKLPAPKTTSTEKSYFTIGDILPRETIIEHKIRSEKDVNEYLGIMIAPLWKQIKRISEEKQIPFPRDGNLLPWWKTLLSVMDQTDIELILSLFRDKPMNPHLYNRNRVYELLQQQHEEIMRKE